MKYGSYTATRARYSVLVGREPYVDCTYDKKKRKNICRNRHRDIKDTHRVALPEPIAVNVTAGSGCYLGHLTLNVINGDVKDFDMQYDAELTTEKLATLEGDVAAAVQQFVNRPCHER